VILLTDGVLSDIENDAARVSNGYGDRGKHISQEQLAEWCLALVKEVRKLQRVTNADENHVNVEVKYFNNVQERAKKFNTLNEAFRAITDD